MALKRVVAVLAVSALFVQFGCTTAKWAKQDPWPKYPPDGSYKGVGIYREGVWWMPSKIGPAKGTEVKPGNTGVVFYAGEAPKPVAEKPPEVKVVEKIVYKAVPVTKEVHADRYIFPTITFAEGSADLPAKAKFDEKKGEFVSGGTQIEQAAELIKKSGSDKVRVEGNIDPTEKAKYPNLSRTRAEAVAKALADLGVDPKVLEIVDDGASKPLASSDTEVGRALNRRVAFTVIPRGQSLEPETLVQPPAPAPAPNTKIVEKVVEKEVATPKLVITDHFIFPNILFEYNKATLTPAGLQNTKEAAEALKTIKGLKRVVVAGNCDSRGSDAYNDKLSMRRADSVKSELEKEGLKASMLEAVGNGKRKPIASNDTPLGMAANRRVEFEVEH